MHNKPSNLGTGGARQVVNMLDNVNGKYFEADASSTVAQLAGCIDAPEALPGGSVVWSRALQEPRQSTSAR